MFFARKHLESVLLHVYENRERLWVNIHTAERVYAGQVQELIGNEDEDMIEMVVLKHGPIKAYIDTLLIRGIEVVGDYDEG